jgi:hypothetical protein
VVANSVTLPPDASSLERKFWGAWTLYYPQYPLIAEFDDIPLWEADFAKRQRLSRRSKRYRLDFVHEPSQVGIEIQGAIYTGGRHVTGTGYERDATKYNLAYAAGWIVFLITPMMVKDYKWYELIAATIESRVDQRIPGVVNLPLPSQTPSHPQSDGA